LLNHLTRPTRRSEGVTSEGVPTESSLDIIHYIHVVSLYCFIIHNILQKYLL